MIKKLFYYTAMMLLIVSFVSCEFGAPAPGNDPEQGEVLPPEQGGDQSGNGGSQGTVTPDPEEPPAVEWTNAYHYYADFGIEDTLESEDPHFLTMSADDGSKALLVYIPDEILKNGKHINLFMWLPETTKEFNIDAAGYNCDKSLVLETISTAEESSSAAKSGITAADHKMESIRNNETHVIDNYVMFFCFPIAMRENGVSYDQSQVNNLPIVDEFTGFSVVRSDDNGTTVKFAKSETGKFADSEANRGLIELGVWTYRGTTEPTEMW